MDAKGRFEARNEKREKGSYRREEGKNILKQTALVMGGVLENLIQEALKHPIQSNKDTAQAVAEMSKQNPHLEDVDVPVLIICSKKDGISKPSRIIEDLSITSLQNDAGETTAMENKRSPSLERLFPNSPAVRMLLENDVNHHNAPYVLPGKIANVVLYFLKRYQNKNTQ
jgi:hypothetical protein